MTPTNLVARLPEKVFDHPVTFPKDKDPGDLTPRDSWRLSHLVVENFKSYRGKHVIGPFRGLNSIIGPNGSGKSNLLDAIAFVLSVFKRDTRSASLSGLIYVPSCVSEKKPTEASVLLVLTHEEASSSRCENFMRCISMNSQGEYSSGFCINDKRVTMREYQDYLKNFNILSNARNFLAFQGDIIALARKSPLELSLMFEDISEANALRGEIEETRMKLDTTMTQLKALAMERQRHEIQRGNLHQQMEEAQAYQHLKIKWEVARCALLSFQIFVKELDYRRLKDQLECLQRTKHSKEEELYDLSKDIRNRDAEIIQLRGKESQVVNSIAQYTTEQHKKDLEGLAFEETIKYLENTEKKLGDSLAYQEHLKKELQGLIEKNHEALHKTDEELSGIEQEYFEAKRQFEISCPSEAREDYEAFRCHFIKKTSKLRFSIHLLSTQRNLLQVQMDQLGIELNENQRQMEEKKIFLDKSKCSKTEAFSALQKDQQVLAKTLETLEAKKLQLKEAHHLRRRFLEEKATLESQLFKCSSKVTRSPKSHWCPFIDELKKNFNSEHHESLFGMVFQLCCPTRPMYKIAARVALGKFCKCILVDTFETAKKAVSYLKSHQLGIAEFASLDSYDTKIFSDHPLRKLISDLKHVYKTIEMIPSLDTLDYPSKYSSFFQSLLSNTLIVGNLHDAKELKFNVRISTDTSFLRNINIVTLSGEKILRNGNFLVDDQQLNDQAFPEWGNGLKGSLGDEQNLSDYSQHLKERLERLEEVVKKHNVSELEQQVSEISTTTLPQLRLNVELQERRYKLWTHRCEELEKDLMSLQTVVEQLKIKQEQELSNNLTHINQELDQMEKSLTREEENAQNYTTASPHQVKNYKCYLTFEKTFIQKEQAYLEAKRRLESCRIKLKCDIQHQQDDLKKTQDSLERVAENYHQAQSQLKSSRLNQLNLEKTIPKDTIHSLESSLKETRTMLETLGKEIQSCRTTSRTLRQSLHECDREIQTLSNRLEHVRSDMKNLVESAFFEHIPLPIPTTQLDSFAREIHLEGWTVVSLESVSEEFEKMFQHIDSTNGVPITLFTPCENSSPCPFFYLSFILNEEQLASARSQDSECLQCVERELKETIMELTNSMEKKRPNTTAAQQYQALEVVYQDVLQRINQMKQEKLRLEKEHKAFREEWVARFMGCFSFVQTAVQKYYKELTGGSRDDTCSGTAYLELAEDSLSLSGGMTTDHFSFTQPSIFFNVVPPCKRFTSLKNLSGGEQTITALALLFAFHSYRPAPFLILDEVDADLDQQNLNVLANFIQKNKSQIIIISHCDRIFGRAHQLLGVYIDSLKESSAVISLNLTLYAQLPPLALSDKAATPPLEG